MFIISKIDVSSRATDMKADRIYHEAGMDVPHRPPPLRMVEAHRTTPLLQRSRINYSACTHSTLYVHGLGPDIIFGAMNGLFRGTVQVSKSLWEYLFQSRICLTLFTMSFHFRILGSCIELHDTTKSCSANTIG